jgi:hypothetical protein
MRCDHCSTAQSKRSTEQFKGKVQQFLTDGVITKEELSELRSMGGNLGLSLPEQDTIISQLKQEMLSNNSAQRPMTLIDQSRWKAVLRAVENKVFSTDPVAGRVHLDSLRALHKSYPDDETIACLLVFILSEEMINDPALCLPEVDQVLNAPCFAYDTPRKYLTRAVFYRGGTLLGQAKAQRSDGQGNWADMLEQFGEALREAAAALESMFPNSEECHALQVAMMIDSYLLSGDETIREDVNLLLEGAASAAGDSDVGIAIKAAHANALEGLEWGDDREMTIGKGLARGYFSDLFSLNLLTLLKMMEGVDEEDSDFDDEDNDFEMEEESMIGNQIPQATLIPQATPVVGVYSPIPPPLPVKATITQPPPICVPHKSASKDDLQYRLNQLLASFSTSKRIHVPPKIPKQKLFGAQMTFLPKDEEVILLVDNSLLGGTPFALCEEGFAITREGICGKGVRSNKLSIKIADIHSTGYNEPNIWINGKIFVELAMLTHAEISKILEIVQIYVDLLKK